MVHFQDAQAYMVDQRIDGWLVYDFRGSNAMLAQLLPGERHTTRRAVLYIPAVGDPVILHSPLDDQYFTALPIRRETFIGWQELQSRLRALLAGKARVAMEYVPGGALPVVSIVDAGTVEFVRALGVEVVSSANIVQVCIARWSPQAVELHAKSSAAAAEIMQSAFALIGSRLKGGERVFEHEIQQHIMDRFTALGMEFPDPPICAVNGHAGDPHYAPSAEHPCEIRKGDWVLIDLWGRVPGEANIYADITWVGFCGSEPSAKHREVYAAVKAARDAAVARAQGAWQRGERVQGWQLDDAAREKIIAAGYGHAIKHRTGHSLSPGKMVHGLGMNLDNLETFDTREMLPGIGFTVEPGIYLPEFGVRLEINMYVDPKKGPVITSCVQDEIVKIGV